MLLNNHMIDQGQSFARSKEINKAGYIASILVYAKFSPHKLKTEKRTAENIQISKRGRGYHPVVVLQIRSRTSMEESTLPRLARRSPAQLSPRFPSRMTSSNNQ
jgi:hypothetical protein